MGRSVSPEFTINELKIKIEEVNGEIKALKTGIKRLDQRIDNLGKRIDNVVKRIDHFDSRIDNILYTVFTGICILIGFILWDRRTTLAPAIKKNCAIERVLIRFSENDPEMKEALKLEGIL